MSDPDTAPTRRRSSRIRPARKPKPPARKPKGDLRHGPALRLAKLRAFLNSSGGATVYDIMERLDMSLSSANRYLRTLEASGEPLYEETVGRRKVWRMVASGRRHEIRLSTTQMISLFLARRVLDFLADTGFKEDLDEVFGLLEATFREKDAAAARNLERKIFNVNEAVHDYKDRIEDVNAIVTALLEEQRLRVTHGSVDDWKTPFDLDPYTLLVYKKGLYLAGHSHHHGAIRTFSLDGFKEVEWLRGARFKYPADYDPAKLHAGSFGLIVGEPTHVRIWFSQLVRRFVYRRRWHPTQKWNKVPGGLVLSMDVKGTAELKGWILEWGSNAEVLEPESLRQEVAAELERAVARYRGLRAPVDR